MPPAYLKAPDWGLIRYDQVLNLIKSVLQKTELIRAQIEIILFSDTYIKACGAHVICYDLGAAILW